jgi:hypothetical protein
MKKRNENLKKELVDYAWSFYGSTDGHYSEFFDHSLDRSHLIEAVDILENYCHEKGYDFGTDSYHREVIRDLILTLYDYPEIQTMPIDGYHHLEHGYTTDLISEWYKNSFKQTENNN